MDWSQTVFPGAWSFAAACLIMACCHLVYLTLGFGAGLLAVALFALILPEVQDAVILLLLLALPFECWIVARSRRQIAWKGLWPILAGLAVGVPFGAWALSCWESPTLLQGLGATLIVVGLVFLLLPQEARIRWRAWAAAGLGLLSGLLAGLFGTGGPPLIAYYHLGHFDKKAFRAYLMAIFLLTALYRIPNYILRELFTSQRLLSAAFLLPAALGGAVAGQLLHKRIGERPFRRLVALALMCLGVLLLLRLKPS